MRDLVRYGMLAMLLGLAVKSWAYDLEIYATYEDYVNQTPHVYVNAAFKKWEDGRSVVLIFVHGEREKEKVEIHYENTWGFAWHNSTYRLVRTSTYFGQEKEALPGTPYRIEITTEVVLYHNGLGLLDTFKNDHTLQITHEVTGMLSKDLGSDMACVPGDRPRKWMDEQILGLLSAHEELADLKAEVMRYKTEHDGNKGASLDWNSMFTIIRKVYPR